MASGASGTRSFIKFKIDLSSDFSKGNFFNDIPLERGQRFDIFCFHTQNYQRLSKGVSPKLCHAILTKSHKNEVFNIRISLKPMAARNRVKIRQVSKC